MLFIFFVLSPLRPAVRYVQPELSDWDSAPALSVGQLERLLNRRQDLQRPAYRDRWLWTWRLPAPRAGVWLYISPHNMSGCVEFDPALPQPQYSIRFIQVFYVILCDSYSMVYLFCIYILCVSMLFIFFVLSPLRPAVRYVQPELSDWDSAPALSVGQLERLLNRRQDLQRPAYRDRWTWTWRLPALRAGLWLYVSPHNMSGCVIYDTALSAIYRSVVIFLRIYTWIWWNMNSCCFHIL